MRHYSKQFLFNTNNTTRICNVGEILEAVAYIITIPKAYTTFAGSVSVLVFLF